MAEDKNTTGTPAYLAALKAFTHILNTELRDGGKIPGVREMCKRLDISSRTYLKITSILAHENILKMGKGCGGSSVPPLEERPQKIGLIYQDGGVSPFLGNDPEFAAFLKTVNDYHLPVVMLQSPNCENLYDNALTRNVVGLVWMHPPEELYPKIREIQENGDMPCLVLSRKQEIADLNGVWRDFERSAEKVVELLIRKKKKSALCLEGFTQNEFLTKKCAEQGISVASEAIPRLNFEQVLPGILAKRKPDVLLCGCGYLKAYRAISKVLAAMPKKERPALFFVEVADIPSDFRKQHPDITVIGRITDRGGGLGIAAAEMMIGHLRKNESLSLKKVDVFSILPPL